MKTKVENLEQLKAIVKELAKKCVKPDFFILLKGELGAGKTTFTKLLLKEIGLKESVTSPTFNILNQYEINGLCINHMDAYRLTNDSEIDMYIEQFQKSLNIIEWYENLQIDFNQLDSVVIELKILDKDIREISINW